MSPLFVQITTSCPYKCPYILASIAYFSIYGAVILSVPSRRGGVVILSTPPAALTGSQKMGERRICDRIGDIVLNIVKYLSKTCMIIIVSVHLFSLMSVQMSVQPRLYRINFNIWGGHFVRPLQGGDGHFDHPLVLLKSGVSYEVSQSVRRISRKPVFSYAPSHPANTSKYRTCV